MSCITISDKNSWHGKNVSGRKPKREPGRVKVYVTRHPHTLIQTLVTWITQTLCNLFSCPLPVSYIKGILFKTLAVLQLVLKEPELTLTWSLFAKNCSRADLGGMILKMQSISQTSQSSTPDSLCK